MISIENIDAYLQEISATSPQGDNLKYEKVYDDIQEAAREDLDLPQGVWVKDLKAADWQKVESLCTDVLIKKSKDLQVAAWLLRAWMHLYDINGITKGFELLERLTEKYWDNAYPVFDEKDPDFRSAPYNWINEKLSDYMNMVPITNPTQDSNCTIFHFASYIDTQHGVDVKDPKIKKEIQTQREKLALDLKKSIQKTEDNFFKDFQKNVNETQAYVTKLQQFLDEKMGKGGPSLYRIRDKLELFRQYVEWVLSEKEKEKETKERVIKGMEITKSEKVATVDEKTALNDTIHGRGEAYAMIEKAADYLVKLDPHSPAPYLIKRAVRWGHLSFDELLKEMIHDQNTLMELKRLFGVENKGSAASLQQGAQDLGDSKEENNSSATSSTGEKSTEKPFWSIQD